MYVVFLFEIGMLGPKPVYSDGSDHQTFNKSGLFTDFPSLNLIGWEVELLDEYHQLILRLASYKSLGLIACI